MTAAIAELGLHWERLPDLAALRDALEGEEKPGREPLAVFVPAGGKLLSDACLALRAHARFAQVPAFGIAANPDDLTFVDLFQSGGDDLVPPLRSSVLRRLRPLLTRAAGEPPSRRAATVIIAGSDRIWRSVLGRTFWNGGLSVRFADDPAQCVADGGAEGVRLVVVLDEEGRSTVDYVRKARAAGQTAPWIVVAPPRRLREVSAELRGIEKAAVTDAFAPPENVLFLANELGRPRGEDARASARLLFGTRVSFRVAGRETDEVGFTYNMSAGGLYVRTAAPVDPGTTCGSSCGRHAASGACGSSAESRGAGTSAPTTSRPCPPASVCSSPTASAATSTDGRPGIGPTRPRFWGPTRAPFPRRTHASRSDDAAHGTAGAARPRCQRPRGAVVRRERSRADAPRSVAHDGGPRRRRHGPETVPRGRAERPRRLV
ncbi:MAG: hypothetical protein IPG50_37840 [Myxococcales bacterium]|nr:hypothetical protein [Myxococcales bacterium]